MNDIFDQFFPETSLQISTKSADAEAVLRPTPVIRLPDRTEKQHRDLQRSSMALRKKGWNYDDISDELGVAPEEAYYAVVAYLRRVADEYEEISDVVRALESERLDDMFGGIYKKAVDGDLEAVRTSLKVMDRRAKLRGLDAPKRVTADVRRSDIRLQVTEIRRSLETMGDDDLESRYRAALEVAGCSGE